MNLGKVYLIGAGPGEPELITVRGVRCLEEADVVVYDRLVDERLLTHARKATEFIYAGKQRGGKALSQEEINALLVAKAQEGKVVARLKGGDPFVLGRGGEEAEALVARSIPFQVVPGVTAAVAVPAYAGIPVTHRRLASSFAVITGHEDPEKGESRLNWEKLATAVDTLVFLMGVENFPEITDRLMANGRPGTTPAAAIQWGTYPRQVTVTGTVADIAQRAEQAGLSAPAVLVVGEVVGMREKLRWFDNQPLFGKRMLITRSRHQASRLAQLLAASGAQPLELPTIEIQTAPTKALDRALSQLGNYGWIIFTSVNGVAAFFDRLSALGRDTRTLGGVRICAIGEATAEAIKGYGLNPDLVPQDFSTEGVLQALKQQGIAGANFLLPRTDAAGPELAQGLERLGARAEQLIVYRTTLAPAAERAQELVTEADIVTFTSSSTVKGLWRMLGGKADLLRGKTIACIGPVTARTALDLGLPVDVVAAQHTIPALVEALIEYERRKAEGVRDERS